MASTYLRGLALRNFRGIGDSLLRLAPLQDINFFIGPNNAGKSTVLRFLANYLHRPKSSQTLWARTYDPLDIRVGSGTAQPKFEVAISKSELIQSLTPLAKGRHDESIGRIVDYLSDGDVVWMRPNEPGNGLEFYWDKNELSPLLQSQSWFQLWATVTNQSGGDLKAHWIPETLVRFANAAPIHLPQVRFIPAIREISGPGQEFDDYSGRGLIDSLAELQNPPHNERNKRQTFEAINAFLREVTDSPEAQIEIPHDRRYVMVHMDDKVLPLSSLGTGIHEVVMLASFCTLVQSEIVCIEEPEIHLHPILQRKLIRYLASKTSNQYFIATHSASLIDSVEASIFNVENSGGETNVTLAVTANDRFEICRALGYHASDLLQANMVIWVEGPSDRIYLRHWIKSIDPSLVEGVDYSIMFYGGRLLAHLSSEDPEVTEFISLRRLNRNMVILIDSDKRSAQSRISATKARIQSELGDQCWITSGREIENYVPTHLIEVALRQIYPERFGSLINSEKYAHRLHFRDKKTEAAVEDSDKVKVAKAVSMQPADLSELDLGEKIGELVRNIQRANHAR